MPVTHMTLKSYPANRYKRPELGDKKVAKDGTVLVRRQCYHREFGKWYAQVQWGRPVAEWVPEDEPWPWDR